ncbi:hypothetical protein HMPREF1423_00107 [Helicobacter pylori GAM270ASi]|nr:hypothetical protein HMPREF1423_00107 [Helicobacter pylori GAM270ASi]
MFVFNISCLFVLDFLNLTSCFFPFLFFTYCVLILMFNFLFFTL